MYVYIYICMYLCVCVCDYIHTHKYIKRERATAENECFSVNLRKKQTRKMQSIISCIEYILC